MPPRTLLPELARRLGFQCGEDARQRLLRASLKLFADKGFAQTSVRDLAEAAGVNVASISYYFGDKAGLYKAVFFAPLGDVAEDIARYSQPGQTLVQALEGFYAGFLLPLRDGEAATHCMKLRFREMIEPTGLWAEELSGGIRPMHAALLDLLCRHLGLPAPDDDLQRLAMLIAGLGVHLHVGRDVIDDLAPQLNAAPDALDAWARLLTQSALAMVQAEAQRRGLVLPTVAPVAPMSPPPAPHGPAAPSAAAGPRQP
ncbi:MAG: CerR family C-terminal domain-containing protein [Rubrivivax sp.]|jgi:AcrR family transcriptional regulator